MTNAAKRAITHSSIYALGNITRQLAGFIMLPVYTRHLSPTDYGVVGLLMALMALVEVFFGARLTIAVPRFYFEEQDPLRRKAVISTAFLVTGSVSLLTTAILIWQSNSASHQLFNTFNYSTAISLFATLIVTQAIEYYAMTFIRIQQRPWFFITTSLLKLILQLSLNIWFVVYEQMGVTGVALGSAISSSVFAAGLAIYTLNQVGVKFCNEQALQMLKFSWPLWVGGLAGLFIGSANRYFINIFSSTAGVGLFELATKFSAILTMLIWDPFQQYWQAERYKLYQQENAISIYGTTFQIISALLAIGALGIGLFADPAIKIMADPAFQDAARAVPWLVIGSALSCLTLFANFSFLVKDQTSWIARNDYMTAALLAILLLLLTPQWGFIGAAIAGTLTYALQFLIVYRAGRNVYDMKLPIKSLFSYLLVVAVALGISRVLPAANIWMSIAINALILTLGGLMIALMLLRQPAIRAQLVHLLPSKIAGPLERLISFTHRS